MGIEGGRFARGQLRSYQRTPVGFFAAQLLSQENLPCVVMGTGNFDEVGLSTREVTPLLWLKFFAGWIPVLFL